MEMKLFFILLFLNLWNLNGCTSKMCFNDNSSGTKTWHCCENYEERNGSCVECNNGYFSDDGEACQKCRRGFYGTKCAAICKCEDMESCHHIKGCHKTPDTTVFVETDRMISSSYLTSTRTTNGESGTFRMISSWYLTTIKTTNGETGTELTTENREMNPVENVNRTSSAGSQNTQIGVLVYSICTGLITFILLFSLCIYRYRHAQNIRNRQQRVVLQNNILQSNIPEPEESIGYFEDIYEMIDESKMLNVSMEMVELKLNFVDTGCNQSKSSDRDE